MGSLILRFAERARDGDGGAKGVSERAVHDRALDRPGILLRLLLPRGFHRSRHEEDSKGNV